MSEEGWRELGGDERAGDVDDDVHGRCMSSGYATLVANRLEKGENDA